MPVAPQVTYPGVYIQEVPSDVRTIVGVDTATTAFIGRARRGPIDTPEVINNFGDFDRIFGGLWLKSTLGYAVEDFFLNGGVKAIVVRVYTPNDVAAHAPIDANGLQLEAKHPGSWGNALRVRVTYLATDEELNNKEDRKGQVAHSVAARYPGVKPEELFTLTVYDAETGETEVFENVTANTGPRPVGDVLKNSSELVRLVSKPEGRPAAHPEFTSSKDFPTVWDDPNAHSLPAEEADRDGSPPADITGNEDDKSGLYALEDADIFNLLCIPPYAGEDVTAMADVPTDVWAKAAAYCVKRRAILLVDPPQLWKKKDARDGVPLADIGASANAAIYFPQILKANSLRDKQIENFAPCGVVAGVMARTDATRGVWKAPAGLEANLTGVTSLGQQLTDAENGELNPLGINCLRRLSPAGNVVWGARTLAGDDRLASEWKYLSVRRTALYIEESLFRNIKWAVFEPNDEPLWSQLRLNIGVFMNGLFRQGAFQGQNPQDAYLVKCDSSTTTQADIDKGIVNIIVGFAPLKPAEFVIIYIKQLVGQLAV